MSTAREAVAAAARRGAPSPKALRRAVAAGAIAQLATVALVGGAAGLLTWSAARPGLGAVAGLLLAVELVAFLRAPLRHRERLAAHDLGLDGLSGWRTWLLDAVSSWSPSRLAAARSGDLLARCLEDADALQDLWVRAVVPAAAATLALVAAGVLLAVLEPVAGVAVLLVTAVVAGAVWSRVSRVAASGVEEAGLRGAAAARAVELAHGADALRLLGADAAHLARTARLVERADHLASRREATIARLGLVATAAGAAALLAAVAGAPLPTDKPWLAAGVVLATLACGELLAALPGALEPLGHVAGAAARLGALSSPPIGGDEPLADGPLVLEDVDVAPAAVGPVLLSGVDLAVAPQARVAVFGPTGSGKSSLLAVAAALEPPRRGRVTLGGKDLAHVDGGALRHAVGWLPTQPSLLEGRVRDVLDVGRGLDDTALSGALETVGLAGTLAPRGGLEYVVGPRGEGLSAGERRLLALARVLAGTPRVAILDEPTAGLDDASCERVLDAVGRSGAAVLAATHDPRVLAWASTRARVRDGRVDVGASDDPSPG